jgi:hypothetical protein
MAWTVTRYPTVFGDKRVVGLKLTADAATQTVETGLSVIEWYTVGANSSMATNVDVSIFINSNASGVQSMGVLGLSGFTTGDDLYVTVFGR